MLKVGLTGGIGSGKTTVARLFELMGVPVYYADDASKRLYVTDTEMQEDLKKHFGEHIFTGDQLDRSALAKLVFEDPDKLALLNSIVHPRTIADAERWMNAQTSPYIVKEAALLFESGSVTGLDYVIGVSAPIHYRIKRVMERDGVTRDAFYQRANRQIDESIKMKLCDFVIRNNELELVIPQVLKLHEKLIALAGSETVKQP